MSIAYQEAGDDSAGQENWGGSWRADGPGGKEPLQMQAPGPQLQCVLHAEETSCYTDHSL